MTSAVRDMADSVTKRVLYEYQMVMRRKERNLNKIPYHIIQVVNKEVEQRTNKKRLVYDSELVLVS